MIHLRVCLERQIKFSIRIEYTLDYLIVFEMQNYNHTIKFMRTELDYKNDQKLLKNFVHTIIIMWQEYVSYMSVLEIRFG